MFLTAAFLVAFIVMIAGWHYWVLYSSLSDARTGILGLHQSFDSMGLDVTEHELTLAEERVREVDKNLHTARNHLDWDPLLQAGKRLPIVGSQFNAVDDVVGIGSNLTLLMDEAIVVGREAIAVRERGGEEASPVASVVQMLDDTGPSLDRIEALVAETVEMRLGLGDDPLLAPLNRARNQLDEQLPTLVSAVDTLSRARDVVPAVLGFDGERRYLLVALNNGEILPGGGLVTAAGVVSVTRAENGPIEFTDSTLWTKAWQEAGGGYIEPPGPLKRYLLRDFTWNLLVSNWTPDFPTWSQQALEFYEMVHGPQDVDGVIAVDLIVLERLLELTGPIPLEVPEFGPIDFASDNVTIELERITRRPFEPGDDRKATIGDLAVPLLDRLHALPSDKWSQLISTVQELSDERHIQVFSFHEEEQRAIHDAGMDGSLDSAPGDFVSVNEASVLGGKISLILDRHAEHTVDIAQDGSARHTLHLRYRNPFPEWAAAHDAELVEALMNNGLYGGYIRVFTPAGATGLSVEVNGKLAGFEDTGIDGTRHWMGVLLRITAGQEVDAVFRWTVPAGTAAGNNPYELRIQKQPGLRELCTTFNVTVNGAPALARLNEQIIGNEPICLTRDVTLSAAPTGAG